VEFLFAAARHGVDFDRTMMLGHHRFITVRASDVVRTSRQLGQPMTRDEAVSILTEAGGFIDPLLSRFGALEIRSLDASPYEGATDIHDLNAPLPDGLRRQFSVVIDGGTLEHVFNYPQALANAMEMVAVNGHLLLVAPTNGEGGHGMYQLAPELFFRVLGRENGFKLETMLIRKYPPAGGHWYEVIDPKLVGARSEFSSVARTFTSLLVV
jgi:hypothetical protein